MDVGTYFPQNAIWPTRVIKWLHNGSWVEGMMVETIAWCQSKFNQLWKGINLGIYGDIK